MLSICAFYLYLSIYAIYLSIYLSIYAIYLCSIYLCYLLLYFWFKLLIAAVLWLFCFAFCFVVWYQLGDIAAGVGKGTTSLLKHSVYGFSNAASHITQSVSNTLALLSSNAASSSSSFVFGACSGLMCDVC